MARVMVAMSGGVDSSVAAALLVQQGHEVVGVTMKLLDLPEGIEDERTCCSVEAVRRARAVCHRLGIPHYTLNFTAVFRQSVVEPFVAEYAWGRTPNPCLNCNAVVKWEELRRRAKGVGCEYLATGHYARVEIGEGRWRLRRGLDPEKDQSYALYGLSQEALAGTRLPLGELRKTQVREYAARLELPTAETPESQDICFIPEGDYREFLRGRVGFTPGPIVNERGEVVGEHEGLAGYTVGQRRGLAIGGGEVLYVLRKRLKDNCLVVGPREALERRSVTLEAVNWVSRPGPEVGGRIEAEIELRYRGEAVPGTVTALADGRARVELRRHTQAVAPGQAAVFYEGDVLLGGGIISEEELPDSDE